MSAELVARLERESYRVVRHVGRGEQDVHPADERTLNDARSALLARIAALDSLRDAATMVLASSDHWPSRVSPSIRDLAAAVRAVDAALDESETT